jgi:ATP adenylyltransferase
VKNKNKILWAPWRVKYITKPDDEKCVFCAKSSKGRDTENFILYRGKQAFALLNIFPYNNGHVMVAPYEHVGDINKLPDSTMHEMMDIVKKLTAKIKKQMNAQGFNIGMNLGRISGAGFDKHLHIHIVPRWPGDTNFMPVICDEKIISESLESVYEKIRFE